MLILITLTHSGFIGIIGPQYSSVLPSSKHFMLSFLIEQSLVIYFYPHKAKTRGGNISFCLFVCLSVSNITQKVIGEWGLIPSSAKLHSSPVSQSSQAAPLVQGRNPAIIGPYTQQINCPYANLPSLQEEHIDITNTAMRLINRHFIRKLQKVRIR